jgi:hypothetical protein
VVRGTSQTNLSGQMDQEVSTWVEEGDPDLAWATFLKRHKNIRLVFYWQLFILLLWLPIDFFVLFPLDLIISFPMGLIWWFRNTGRCTPEE